MRIAIIGTRGIPANYGGFETFAEELSTRLAVRGHEATAYCRAHHTPRELGSYRGVRLVVLPSLRHKYLETVSHSFLSTLHALRGGYDVALFCNAANAFCLPFPRLMGTRTAINVDGLEWKRKKWSWLGKSVYRISEKLACLLAGAVVTDAVGIQSYYREVHGTETDFIPYGTLGQKAETQKSLEQFGLEPRKYFLYVSRLEPENNAHLVIKAFERVETDFRLVIVGDAPYAEAYIRELKSTRDPRVLFTGYVYGRGYRELMSHAYCYIHATEVGGTHPALVEGMGLGNGILVSDVPENREVVADSALFFGLNDERDLTGKMRLVLDQPELLAALAGKARERASRAYDWDAITDAYLAVFERLSSGKSDRAVSPKAS